MRENALACCLFLLLWTTACTPGSQGPPPVPAVDVAAESAVLLAVDQEFSRASETLGMADAFHRYLAEDALQLPHLSQPIEGREAIYQGLLQAEGVTLTWQPQKAEVARSGDLGYTWGTYEIQGPGEREGETRVGHGKYLNVWRKQADGSWKVLIDMGNASPAPE